MDSFITILRALATCIITNSHYTGIYPTDLITQMSLGMVGNFLFFAVSGYCIANIKTGFFSWYKKRVFRCYIPLFIATAFFLLVSQFYEPIQYMFSFDSEVNVFFPRFYDITVNSANAVPLLFVYPTLFHFVSTISLLYIPYYFVAKYVKNNKQLLTVFFCTAAITLVLYSFVYDNSYFHIDVPREPMIRLLFFLAMLLGLWFKRNKEAYVNRFKARHVIELVVLIPAYAACKYLLEIYDNNSRVARFQIIYAIITLWLVYAFFTCLMSVEEKLKRIKHGRSVIDFLAESTLEIYLVQVPLIELVRDIFSRISASWNPSNRILVLFDKFNLFPLNWIMLTLLIIVFAALLRLISNKAFKLEERISCKIKNLFNK